MKFIKLFETYKSQKDLEYLTKVILDRIADKTFDSLQSNVQKVYQFKHVELNEINRSKNLRKNWKTQLKIFLPNS